jgi:2-polyprenyl-3-methyl-5-hydroxy-6-metoxy-1,4-benzoquinol methylase
MKYQSEYKKKVSELLEMKDELITEMALVNKKLLDVGCNQGFINEKITKNNTIIGIDIDGKNLSIAKDRGYITKKINLNSIKQLPFRKNTFDVILLWDILEHLIEPNNLIDECERILKKEGILIVSIPNTLNIINRFRFMFGIPSDITDNTKYKHEFSDHLHIISYKKIKKTLTQKYSIMNEYNYTPTNIKNNRLRFLQPFAKICVSLKLNYYFKKIFSFAFIFRCTKK